MGELFVYRLDFTDRSRLEAAFGVLLDSDSVVSCVIEPETVSARFMSTAAPGSALVERIYAIGGLRWCSRHTVQSPAP